MAVYTSLNHNEISDFLAHYDVGELVSFKGIAEGVENTNYMLVVKRGAQDVRYILTIYEQRVNPKDLPFFLGLTQWLADRQIVCPRPVVGAQGEMTFSLKNKPAALIHFLEGQGCTDITLKHLALTGDLIARMHLAAEGFPLTRRNSLSLDGWHSLFGHFRNHADTIMPGLEKMIADELAYLDRHWPHALPGGVVHADIFPDNVFFRTNAIGQPELSGIIDFYFACNESWAYDLVICMNAWCFDGAHYFIPERAKALVQAYHRFRPMTDAEWAAMPILARGAALRFLLTRAYDWLNRVDGAMVTPKNPMEYVAKLRYHQRINRWQEYGL